eukprot:jgi/Ulvmu1/3037/UM015_0077.1
MYDLGMIKRSHVNKCGPGRFSRPQNRLRAPRNSPPHLKLKAVPDDSRYPAIPVAEEAGQAWNDVPQYDVEQHQPVPAVSATTPPQPSLTDRIGNGALFGLAAFFGGTFLVSAGSYFYKYNQPEAKARRKLLNNQKVVRTLAELLPSKRDQVTSGMLRQLQFVTGFTPAEVFRKFLWYILKDRKFDQAAVDDLVHLKDGLKLPNDHVAEALKERCVRIEKKFGNLMLNSDGLSEKAIQRKATCRALFSKMLYLIEYEPILQPNEIMSVDVLRDIFGATEEDVQKLKIVSIQEVDIDVLDSMVGSPEDA